MEMDRRRDFPPTAITRRYAILSSPRSGSTLLGRMLFATGLAGDPLEYFGRNLLTIQREKERKPALSPQQLLAAMERRRTSPNGVFGMKMHYAQFLFGYQTDLVDERMLRFLRAQTLIWIRRRDRLAQAVSYAVAIRSNAWSSEVTGRAEIPPIHPADCVNCLQEVCWDDRGWETLIDAAGLVVHTVWYEDLVADYEGSCRAVLLHLGLDEAGTHIPPPPISRQADARNAAAYRALCDYLGAGRGRPSNRDTPDRTLAI